MSFSDSSNPRHIPYLLMGSLAPFLRLLLVELFSMFDNSDEFGWCCFNTFSNFLSIICDSVLDLIGRIVLLGKDDGALGYTLTVAEHPFCVELNSLSGEYL
uniref:Uncharacterized protein n=1 Tax=Cacopsylla melanoneura TaxID=428564 RepID=A0A8D8MC63_9HEMI